MASPSSAITRFDLSFSYQEFNAAANRAGCIAHKVLPPALVALAAAQFMKVTLESVLSKREDTKRRPKSGYSRGDYQWTTDSWNTEDHGVEEAYDQAEINRYGNAARCEQIHRERALNRVLLGYEYDAAAAVFNTSTWTGASLTTAITTAWSTHASATPVADIDAAIDKVITGCGMRPNTLILSDYAWNHLIRTADLLAYIASAGSGDPKVITRQIVAQVFDLEQVLVGSAYLNTADQGQTASPDRVWTKTMAMLAHCNAGQDYESPRPNIGRTFMWNEENGAIPGSDEMSIGALLETYEEPATRQQIVRCRNNRDVKILHVEAAHLLTNAAA